MPPNNLQDVGIICVSPFLDYLFLVTHDIIFMQSLMSKDGVNACIFTFTRALRTKADCQSKLMSGRL